MNNSVIMFSLIMLMSVFVSSLSQVLLKKSALEEHDNIIKEYLNVKVIVAYGLFFASTVITIVAYKVVPLSLGPVLEATSYLYITYFGVKLFNEKINSRKIVALILIVTGIIVYSVFGGL